LCSLASSQAPSVRSFSWSQPSLVLGNNLTSAVVVRSKGNMNKQLLARHMGIFTELGVLYARYRLDKLMEHIKIFYTRVNIPELIRVCDEQQHWKELTYLYIQYDEFNNVPELPAGFFLPRLPVPVINDMLNVRRTSCGSYPCCLYHAQGGRLLTSFKTIHGLRFKATMWLLLMKH